MPPFQFTNIRNSEQIMELLKTLRSHPKAQTHKTDGKKEGKTYHKTHSYRDKMDVNNLRDKSSPINKEDTLKNSQKLTTKEQIIALLDKSTPNGYIINHRYQTSKNSEYKRRGMNGRLFGGYHANSRRKGHRKPNSLQFILEGSATVETLRRNYKNEYMGNMDKGLQKILRSPPIHLCFVEITLWK
ncbi:hypothetical protein PIB30_089858 [Stylosanthes scabra]|uniref:HNH homing endonuclease n=1 Tax=Stylosanthes scabra TaxID=79078 RepID=A0ABU6SUI3_9FABA|nr:hypothetical protein [Stylosanthes scabra]